MPTTKHEPPPPLSELVKDKKIRAEIDQLMNTHFELHDQEKEIKADRDAVAVRIAALMKKLKLTKGSNDNGFVTIYTRQAKLLDKDYLLSHGVPSAVLKAAVKLGKVSEIVRISRFKEADGDVEEGE